ncbi:hypothetical protein FE784_10835 [Paenibacillus hemerocallicola]|uniref:YlzJ-like protein n=1 Tax=Paenibacillus hemerocallicola TaxID=1172614 RepID=A0A5C4TAT9_9BACL|nr:YlzJ-like family protein [Paenibacillus hemerocallicola]TNJ66168.1 hypothetical protein FE784_10835 [Paenibacillus hemerocallicola]
MILYTQVPIETVLDGMDNPPPATTEITVNGVLMQVEATSSYQGKIVRLLSPDPFHYLNPSYAPGQLIEFKPG